MTDITGLFDNQKNVSLLRCIQLTYSILWTVPFSLANTSDYCSLLNVLNILHCRNIMTF